MQRTRRRRFILAAAGVLAAAPLRAYGPPVAILTRQSFVYIDRILRGATPAELPIQLPSQFELVVNLKTARALMLEVPQSLLARADRVIQ